MVIWNPLPVSPILLSLGMNTLLKFNSQVDEARIPNLPFCDVIARPSQGVSKINVSKLLDPRLVSLEATTIIIPASFAFVIKCFEPFIRKPPSVLVTNVFMEATSLPASGSVNAKAPRVLALTRLGKYEAFCL